MKKILIIQPFGRRRGGSDNILFTALVHLDRERFEPLVVFHGTGDFVDDVTALGVRSVTLPEGRLRDPRHVVATARRITRILRREDPDLILNWLSTAHVYGGIAAWLCGMSDRCMWWQLDMFADRAPERARLADRLATVRGQVLDRVASAIPAVAIGCCSEAVRVAQQRVPPRRAAFAVLPGIDPPPSVSKSRLAELRRELDIPADALVVGIVGRLFAWKGHHLLLQALEPIIGEDSTVYGLFVGGGGHRADVGYEDYLQALVRERGLTDRVRFTGQVPDAAPYLQLMDIFVNASSPEPFGLVVLEAMALGVPSVAVATGGPAEIIEPGVSGILAPTNDPSDLEASIRLLVDDPRRRASVADAGRARFAERFSGARMTLEMEDRLAGLGR